MKKQIVKLDYFESTRASASNKKETRADLNGGKPCPFSAEIK